MTDAPPAGGPGPRMPFDSVLVVSLPGSADRRAHVTRHLTAAGLGDFRFHDAIGPDDPAVRQAFAEGRVARFPPCFRCGRLSCGQDDCNNVLIPAQVATVLSYVSLWERIAAGPGIVLVCEDDVLLHPWWRRVMAMILRQRDAGRIVLRPDEPALIRLGWAEGEDHTPDQPFRLTRAVRMANPCHIITPAFARAILAETGRIDQTADMILHRSARAAQQWAWTAFPPAATELSWSRGTVESLIHPRPRRSLHLRETGDEAAAAAHDARMAAHLRHMEHRAVLVVGHPRCGTGFTAALMRQMGLDIGHEADGRDGLSSWMFAVEGPVPYARDAVARRREGLHWDRLVMPVRDIATAVPSIMRDNVFAPLSYAFRRTHILAQTGIDLNALPDNLHRAVVSFLQWNRLIEAMGPDLVFRIEHDHDRLHALVAATAAHPPPPLAGLDLSPVNADKPYKGVRRPLPQVGPADWARLPDALWAEVTGFCDRHGYAHPPRAAAAPVRRKRARVDLAGLDAQFCGPSGWSLSAQERRPVRADGTPVPWFTFGAIEFLGRILRPGDRVFEYGAGHSTLWWQERVAAVASVEHDADWVETLRPRLQPHVALRHVGAGAPCDAAHAPVLEAFRTRMRRTAWPDHDADRIVRRGLDDDGFAGYAAAIMDHPPGFDIVVIDGMARRLCCEFAVARLDPDGVIVLDNSNRSDYDAAFDILAGAGFRQIPFWGLVPGAPFMTCTSVFLRSLSRLAEASYGPNSHGLPEY